MHLSRTRKAVFTLAAWSALLVAVWILNIVVPRIKQAALPDHATPEYIEARFADQIDALRAVAEGAKEPDDVAGLFADDAIVAASAVTFYGENKSGAQVKSTPDDRESGGWCWFYTDPTHERAVVNLWSTGYAEYVCRFDGDDGCELWLDLAALAKRAQRES
ncbi:MAG: hypothetical protein V3T86_04910 [Planctomycetota bacterium]